MTEVKQEERTLTDKTKERSVRASYHIAHHIAKHLKPLSEGQFIKDALIIASEEICSNQQVFPEIQLLVESRKWKMT